MPNRTPRGAATALLPLLFACSACSSGPGDVQGSPDAGGGAPAQQESAAPAPSPEAASASSGSSEGGVSAPSDDSGGMASPDDAVGPLPVDEAGLESGPPTNGDAGAATADGGTHPLPDDASVLGDGGGAPLTVYIAGDSTVSQYVLDPNNPKSWAGWGQMFAPHYNSKVTVVDAAIGGRTAQRFILEGHLTAILSTIKAGDYLFVQFGTNDSNTTATYTLNGTTYPYYAAADTDFKKYLQQYIDGAHTKGAIPVLVTPPPRNSAYCGGGQSLANYGQAMIALGATDGVAVVDLGKAAWSYLNKICPKPATAAQETFFKVNPDGTIDGTHFQENGARMLATFVADGVTQDTLGLAAYRIK